MRHGETGLTHTSKIVVSIQLLHSSLLWHFLMLHSEKFPLHTIHNWSHRGSTHSTLLSCISAAGVALDRELRLHTISESNKPPQVQSLPTELREQVDRDSAWSFLPLLVNWKVVCPNENLGLILSLFKPPDWLITLSTWWDWDSWVSQSVFTLIWFLLEKLGQWSHFF